MHPRFRDAVSELEGSFQRLVGMAPCRALALAPQPPQRGVYLFSEGDTHLYVGRSNKIGKRLGNHCRPTASDRMAAFAFRLARLQTGRVKATYRKEGSRSELMKDAAFLAAFDGAKTRIRSMDVRFVEEADPIRQALLEMYVAVVLETPFNDFDTH